MEKDRLAAFMDAVLAIIMTILVLELPKPAEVTFSALWALRSSYFCYILSFFWLGTMWVNLHNEWHHVSSISNGVVWWGIVLLFCSSWIPYAISVASMDADSRVGQFMYGLAVFLVTFANIGISHALEKCHDDEENAQTAEVIALRRKKVLPDIAVKLVGMLLTLTVYPQAMSWAVLVTMLWMQIPFGTFRKCTERGK